MEKGLHDIFAQPCGAIKIPVLANESARDLEPHLALMSHQSVGAKAFLA